MSINFPYSPTQRSLVEAPGSRFVEACPGAGKTHAIIGRFLRHLHGKPRKGVALLSFTNTAVDEAKARSSQRGLIVRAPHYIGTFDSFINRMIVAPIYTSRYGLPVRFVDTWASVTAARLSIQGDHTGGYGLDSFEFNDHARTAKLIIDRVPFAKQASAANMDPGVLARLQVSAVERRRKLVLGEIFDPPRGLLDAETARGLAMRWIDHVDWGPRIVALLAARFAEIIVDEAQDCGPEELIILSKLRAAGVDVVLVGDLDQAIYGFRRAQPSAVRNFVSGIPNGERLAGNYRSSPAICSIVASLRSGAALDEPVGVHRDLTVPVAAMSFRRMDNLEQSILGIADEHKIRVSDVMVLAHKTSHAIKAAGGAGGLPPAGANQVIKFALPALVLNAKTSSPRQRAAAVEEIERALLNFVGRSDDANVAPGVDRLGRPQRWLRDQAIRIAHGIDPTGMTEIAYTDELRRWLKQIDWPNGTLLKKLQKPAEASWRAVLRTSGTTSMLSWSTVHGAKGRQYPMVVVVLPEDLVPDGDGQTCLDLWERKLEGESKRVLYVGASRAEQLLVLAIHESHLERVSSILVRDSVPHRNTK